QGHADGRQQRSSPAINCRDYRIAFGPPLRGSYRGDSSGFDLETFHHSVLANFDAQFNQPATQCWNVVRGLAVTAAWIEQADEILGWSQSGPAPRDDSRLQDLVGTPEPVVHW